MSSQRWGGERALVAVEAARVMYEEGVKQYFTAKRIAARRVLGRTEARGARFRPGALPSNGEIREALLLLARNAEGPRRGARLFVLRLVAARAMEALEGYEPRLIGSVSTGHVRAGSDVDVQLFTDDFDGAERAARALDPRLEVERVTLRKGGAIREYTHLHAAVAPREGSPAHAVEFTLYPRRDLRERPRSSTDGQPIVRRSLAWLRDELARAHERRYERFVREGYVPPVDDERVAGPFDALVDASGSDEAEGDDDDALDACDEDPRLAALDAEVAAFFADATDEDSLPTDDERALLRDDATYDPLPGFEGL